MVPRASPRVAGIGVRMSPVAGYLLVQQCLHHVVGNLGTESPEAELSANSASVWSRQVIFPTL